ncbi:MAG: penicillin-binding transpeptidase domain-containing protein, partial [Candidatus Zipacnadales bacterium]
ITIEGQELKCWKDGGHGTLTLSQALAESCNVYFAHLGQVLGIALMSKYAEESGLFTKPALPLPAGVPQASRLEPRHFDDLAAASYAIGQSDLLITPFAAAQIAAAIANEGQFMSPQLLRAVTRPDGQIIQHFDPRPGERAFRRSTAQLLAGMMEQAVETGTGQAAQLPGIRVAGKTGSAETSGGAAHAWFIGFAPVQQPRVAVAVIIEHEGTGGGVAAPIAREIMQELLY